MSAFTLGADIIVGKPQVRFVPLADQAGDWISQSEGRAKTGRHATSAEPAGRESEVLGREGHAAVPPLNLCARCYGSRKSASSLVLRKTRRSMLGGTDLNSSMKRGESRLWRRTSRMRMATTCPGKRVASCA